MCLLLTIPWFFDQLFLFKENNSNTVMAGSVNPTAHIKDEEKKWSWRKTGACEDEGEEVWDSLTILLWFSHLNFRRSVVIKLPLCKKEWGKIRSGPKFSLISFYNKTSNAYHSKEQITMPNKHPQLNFCV